MADPVVRRPWWALSGLEWLLLFGGWSALGVLQALVATIPNRGLAGSALPLLSQHLPLVWFWALATPAIGAWSAALRSRVGSGLVRLLCHLPAIVVAALAITALRRALVIAAGGALAVPYSLTLLYFADLTITAYVMAVWAAYALEGRRRLLEREHRTTALESRVAAARLEYLEMQVRPHFLFNALSAVAELGHEAPRTAARMLGNIRALLQNATKHNESGAVPLSGELTDLAPYLAIQRIRFADWLELVEEIEPGAEHAMVPRLILQPLVENAVHHGLARRERSGRITISARVSGDRLHVRVADSGEGLKSGTYRESRGLGLRNVRGRIEALYGATARIDLVEDAGGGTAACLDLPMRTAADLEDGETRGSDREEVAETNPLLSDALFEWARRRPWIAIVGAWAVVGLLRFQHSLVYLRFRGRLTEESILSAARADGLVVAVWLLLTPLVLWSARRFAVRSWESGPPLLLHIVLAFGVALGHTALVRGLSGADQPALTSLGYTQLYAWNVAAYATIVALVHVRQIERWISERDLAAARLRLALQEARFQRVMLDLRPGVLIDTLHHVEVVTLRDPVRAERIVADLGDFLRLTLDAVYEPTLTLRQECDRLQAYAKVLRVGVSPDLQLTLAAPVDAMDDPIPNGVLRAALDTVLAEAADAVARVRLDVERLDGELYVSIASDSGGAQAAAAEREEPRLMNYVREGAVRLISDRPDAIRLVTCVRPV